MIQKRNNVLDIETQKQEQEEVLTLQTEKPHLNNQELVLEKERAISFLALEKIDGKIKRKLVVTKVSKVLLDKMNQIMPNFKTQEIIESAFLNYLKFSDEKSYQQIKSKLAENSRRGL